MSRRGARERLNIALLFGVAVLACVWLMHVPGMGAGMAYLASGVFVFLLLWLGRYPGQNDPRTHAEDTAPPWRGDPGWKSARRVTDATRRKALGDGPRGPRSAPRRHLVRGLIARPSRTLHARASCGDAQNRDGVSHSPRRDRKNMTRGNVAGLLAAGALIAPASAQAHISLHPNTIPAGAFATLDIRVPGEQEGAHVTKVNTQLPPGFTGVDYENVAGWSAKVIETKLATPIKEDGQTIDTQVSQIVWTWTGPLGKVNNGQFINFPLSLAIPENATGKALEFRTVQTYSSGQIVHWIEPSLTAEHPSPRINVTAKGGLIEEVAGDEAGPEAGKTGSSQTTPASSTPVAKTSGGASKGLGIVALILGALGLLAGTAALITARRSRTMG